MGYRVVYEAREAAPRPEPAVPSPAPTVSRPPLALVLSLGAAGLGTAVWFGAPAAIGWLGLVGWKAWVGGAAVALAGGLAGLSLSRPRAWLGLPGSMRAKARAAASATWTYAGWLGKRWGQAVLRRDSRLGAVAYLPAVPLAAAWIVVGAAVGGLIVPVRAAAAATEQIIDEMLPWLRKLLDVALRILIRVVPFLWGLASGLIVGGVGTAAFWGVLLGRPFFKYVAAEDYAGRGLLGFLGRVFLRSVSALLGVVFGAFGVAASLAAPAAAAYFGGFPGLAVAAVLILPFPITMGVSNAFRWGEIGGKSQKFFELWSFGALLVELTRLNALTDKFEFKEERSEDGLALVSGWVRLAAVAAAALAAGLAATIAGFVAYVRSLLRAARDLEAGKKPSSSADMEVVSETAGDYARGGGRWLSRLGGGGAGLYAVYLAFTAFSVKTLLGLVLLPAAGWAAFGIAGLALGAMLGATIGLGQWLSDRQ